MREPRARRKGTWHSGKPLPLLLVICLPQSQAPSFDATTFSSDESISLTTCRILEAQNHKQAVPDGLNAYHAAMNLSDGGLNQRKDIRDGYFNVDNVRTAQKSWRQEMVLESRVIRLISSPSSTASSISSNVSGRCSRRFCVTNASGHLPAFKSKCQR